MPQESMMKRLQMSLTTGEIQALITHHRNSLINSEMPTVASDAESITRILKRIEKLEKSLASKAQQSSDYLKAGEPETLKGGFPPPLGDNSSA
jgi:cell division septum initiation protein DivIVA